jgi:hypothetical protein
VVDTPKRKTVNFVEVQAKYNPLQEEGHSIEGRFWGVQMGRDKLRDPDGTKGLSYVRRIGIVDRKDGCLALFAVDQYVKTSFTLWGDMETGILEFQEATRGKPDERIMRARCVKSAVPSKNEPPMVIIEFPDSVVEAQRKKIADATW